MTQTTNIPIITPETREALVTGAAATEVVGSTVVAERQAEAVRALLAASQGALAQLEGMRGLLNLKENARSLNLTHNLSPDSLLEAVIRGDSIPLVGRAGSTPTARGTKAESFVARGLETEIDEVLSTLDKDSQSHRFEHGAHALYLSIGAVEWLENDIEIQSPLLLVPVQISQNRESNTWELTATGGELEFNPALREHLRVRHGPALPEYSSTEGSSLQSLATLIARCLSASSGPKCTLQLNRTTLSLFSPGLLALQKDLDPEGWSTGRDPTKHPFLQALVDGTLRHEAPATRTRKQGSEERFWVLPADSSQQAVLSKVRGGADTLIHGPPGSGKSSTIVNIAADALSQGKRVLIVSEKSDALRVAKHWLDYAGIGDTALLVEPNASRRSIAEELQRTLTLGRPTRPDRTAAVGAFDRSLAYFQSRAERLEASVGKSNLSTYDVLSRAASVLPLPYSTTPHARSLSDPSMLAWDGALHEKVQTLFSKLEILYATHGHPKQLPLFGAESAKALDPQALSAASAVTHTALTSFLEEARTIFSTLELDPPTSEAHLVGSLGALKTIDALYSENGALVAGLDISAMRSKAEQESIVIALQRHRQLAETFEKSKGVINFGYLAVSDLDRITSCIGAHQNKFFKFFDGDYAYALESLQKITQVPRSIAEQITLLKQLKEIKTLLSQQDSDNLLFSDLLGDGWDKERAQLGERRFWQKTSQVAHLLIDFEKVAAELPDRDRLELLLKTPQAVYELSDRLSAALLLKSGYERERHVLFERLGRKAKGDLERFAAQDLNEQEIRLSVWRFHPEGFQAAKEYAALREEAATLGVTAMVKAVEDSGALKDLCPALERGFFAILSDRLIKPSPLVQGYRTDVLRSEREALLKAHTDLLRASAEELALRHWEQLPRVDAGGQSGALLREVEKRNGGKPLRVLFNDTSEALQRVKPLMLMSPQTAAKVLDPAGPRFDLVIFDEASQVRPYSALGAIARASQTVIVGDPEQLDPTSFFERRTEAEGQAPARSLIDAVENAGMQRDELTWHYRSRFPGLIQPSNQAFYKGRLKVFPSPQKGEGADGFVYRYIRGATYDAGKSRTNEREALAIAEAVLNHARTRPLESLGVVALSRSQMDLIAEKVESLRKRNPELESFITRPSVEPFFIKNLETSQGVERDRVMISIGYARTQEGALSLNLGPLSTERGANRLNVLLSRARTACEVFTALLPDEPEFAESQNKSVQTLNKLLRRMNDGVSSAQGSINASEADPLKSMVKRLLEDKGYQVHTLVGEQGQGVDLAVVSRKEPGKYLLGISFDAPSFDQNQTIEDREITRHHALRDRGWSLLEQSVFDWYQNPASAFAEIERALINAELVTEPKTAVQAGHTELSARTILRSNAAVSVPSISEPYRTAVVRISSGEALRRGDAHLARSEIARAFQEILSGEGPLHTETMRERLGESAGALRRADHFDTVVNEVEREALTGKTAMLQNGFLYSRPRQEVKLRDRSTLRGAEKEIRHVPTEEIELAILKAVQYGLRVKAEELPQSVARILGYLTPPNGIDTLVEQSLRSLKEHNLLEEEASYLFLPSSHNG